MNRIISISFALVLACFAIDGRADHIDDYVSAEMHKQRIAGVALAVIKNGKPIKLRTYGVSNLELNTPVKPHTVFKIGSVSKQFIAAATLLLAEEGKLRLDTSITKYLDGAPESWNAITIKHALSHTSGLPRESPGFDFSKVQVEAEVIRAAYGASLRFLPGEKFEYCNLGYFVLAEIVSRASGMPWPDFVRKRIFQPLGMSATRLTDDGGIIPERASGYAVVNDRIQHSPTITAVRPSGAFLSSIEDLAKWNSALDERKLLSPATWIQAWSRVRLNDGTEAPYGYGWYIEDAGPHRMVHHGGAIYGYTAQYSRFDEQQLSIIVLANADASRTDVMALKIAEVFLPGVLPTRKAITLSADALATFAGRYEYPGLGVSTIDVEGTALRWYLPAAGRPVRYIPESANTFYSEEDPRQLITFTRGDQGLRVATITNGTREIARGKEVAPTD